MKFIISRLELNDLINRVQGIVNPRATTPILSNVLIEAANDEIILTTTDSMVGIRCFTETKVLEEGKTTLPMKSFSQLVRELTATNLEITTRNDVTNVVSDASSFKLNGMSAQLFPALPDLDGATRFTLPQPVLKDMFFRTSFAVAREDSRFILTGVLLQIANSVATFVATDAKRLSRAHVSIDLPPAFSGAYSIPLKAIDEIKRNLTDDPQEMVTVFLMNDRIAFEANHVVVITKLLTGEFPDYHQIIPENCGNIFRLHREEMISLLRQISLFTSEDSPSVCFTFNEGELKLTKNSMAVGEGKVSMPVEYQGSKLDIAFSPHSFMEILRHCNQEVVTLGLSDAFSPGLITDQTDALNSAVQPTPLYVLMPLRLSEV